MKKAIEEFVNFKKIASKMRGVSNPGPSIKGWSEYEKGLEMYPKLRSKIALGLITFYKGDIVSSNKAMNAILGK